MLSVLMGAPGVNQFDHLGRFASREGAWLIAQLQIELDAVSRDVESPVPRVVCLSHSDSLTRLTLRRSVSTTALPREPYAALSAACQCMSGNSAAISSAPTLMAKSRGVAPASLTMSGSAPAPRSSSTVATSPCALNTARHSGVFPNRSCVHGRPSRQERSDRLGLRLLCSEVQRGRALPVGQTDVIARRQAFGDAWDIALQCPVVEFLTTLSIHADSLPDQTTDHRQIRALSAACGCVGRGHRVIGRSLSTMVTGTRGASSVNTVVPCAAVLANDPVATPRVTRMSCAAGPSAWDPLM